MSTLVLWRDFGAGHTLTGLKPPSFTTGGGEITPVHASRRLEGPHETFDNTHRVLNSACLAWDLEVQACSFFFLLRVVKRGSKKKFPQKKFSH